MNNNFNISYKFLAIKQRFFRYFHLLPTRLWRLGYHLYRGITFQISRKEYWKDEAEISSRASVILLWIMEFFILFLEVFGLGEFYETITDIGKTKTRPLQTWEIKLAKTIYRDTIDYQQIRIDETAWMGPKQYHFCYVSFNLINSWQRMANHVFIHELMHVWQYQKMGAIYMIRALIAQHTTMGYNYGGVESIKEKINKGESLLDFNLEQQADIITDCFLLQEGYAPQWSRANLDDLAVYQSFIKILEQQLA